MFLCLCGIISVMMTRVLTGLLTFVVPYSMTGSFVFAFVCLFVWTHSVLRRAMSVPYGVQEQLANVRLYSCTTTAKMTMMYCLFVYLLLCVNTIINVWLGSLWSCLPLEIRKGCKHYCCHPFTRFMKALLTGLSVSFLQSLEPQLNSSHVHGQQKFFLSLNTTQPTAPRWFFAKILSGGDFSSNVLPFSLS